MFTEAGKAAAAACKYEADSRFAGALVWLAVVIGAVAVVLGQVGDSLWPIFVLDVPAVGLILWSVVITFRLERSRPTL